MFSSTITRPLQLASRVLQWASAVIVMGITSYFIHKGPRGLSIIYQEVIAVMSVVFFLPAFVSPFMPTVLGKAVIFIDVIFSYLWLTAFIFAAQDYNRNDCLANAPPGLSCGKKKANEAFIFLAFIFTFFGMFLEVANLWAYAREHEPTREKHGAHGGPPDAPAPAPADNV
ncbi:membrane-associating domain-containing protein [Aspergillus ambiguus]|uniref:uncharacterized protein n=1 Tax=Aspergillus ambiguus TaxID=176160 RepID=UPI003CCDC450